MFGQNATPKWAPRTIEFIWVRWNPLKPHTKMISSQNHLFRDPCFGLKRSPGQNVGLRAPKSYPWLKNPPPGMKKQKMRAEKPCRTPPSELQTEPYGASCGQKAFSSQNPKIWGAFWAPFWRLIGPWRHHLSPHWAPLEDVWVGFVNRH